MTAVPAPLWYIFNLSLDLGLKFAEPRHSYGDPDPYTAYDLYDFVVTLALEVRDLCMTDPDIVDTDFSKALAAVIVDNPDLVVSSDTARTLTLAKEALNG